jgi:hypothetical protein
MDNGRILKELKELQDGVKNVSNPIEEINIWISYQAMASNFVALIDSGESRYELRASNILLRFEHLIEICFL